MHTPVFDGVTLAVDEALDAAVDFLGSGYTYNKVKDWYESADQLRRVRMRDNDILGRHGRGPHINLEILGPHSTKPGKTEVKGNIHIYLGGK